MYVRTLFLTLLHGASVYKYTCTSTVYVSKGDVFDMCTYVVISPNIPLLLSTSNIVLPLQRNKRLNLTKRKYFSRNRVLKQFHMFKVFVEGSTPSGKRTDYVIPVKYSVLKIIQYKNIQLENSETPKVKTTFVSAKTIIHKLTFLLFQDSHLALPLKSRSPGLEVSISPTLPCSSIGLTLKEDT